MLYLCYMARDDVQVNFRMPEALKAALEEAARANKRSITAEVVYRLQASIDMDNHAPPPYPDDAYDYEEGTAALLKSMDERYKKILDEVRAINERYEADLRSRLGASVDTPSKTRALQLDEPPPERLPSFIRTEPAATENKGSGGRARILSKDFLHAPPKRDDID